LLESSNLVNQIPQQRITVFFSFLGGLELGFELLHYLTQTIILTVTYYLTLTITYILTLGLCYYLTLTIARKGQHRCIHFFVLFPDPRLKQVVAVLLIVFAQPPEHPLYVIRLTLIRNPYADGDSHIYASLL
jgi:hypothetical protein